MVKTTIINLIMTWVTNSRIPEIDIALLKIEHPDKEFVLGEPYRVCPGGRHFLVGWSGIYSLG